MIDTDRIAPALRGDSVGLSEFGRDRTRLDQRPNLADDFAALGPAAKVGRLSAAVSDSAPLTRFLETGANDNITHRVRSSLPAVAAGLPGYLAICRLIRTQPIPPAPPTLFQWSTLFKGGRTFSLYLSHR